MYLDTIDYQFKNRKHCDEKVSDIFKEIQRVLQKNFPEKEVNSHVSFNTSGPVYHCYSNFFYETGCVELFVLKMKDVVNSKLKTNYCLELWINDSNEENMKKIKEDLNSGLEKLVF